MLGIELISRQERSLFNSLTLFRCAVCKQRERKMLLQTGFDACCFLLAVNRALELSFILAAKDIRMQFTRSRSRLIKSIRNFLVHQLS